MQVFLNFSQANIPLKSPVCGADLSLIGFQGKNYAVAREYPKSNFSFSPETHTLRVHEQIWFEGRLPDTHRIHFATMKKNISYLVDLRFTAIKPGLAWGDGVFQLGKEKMGIFIHIPRAQVEGTIAVNGDTLKVNGAAYMDHTFQTDFAPKLVRSGYRYFSQEGKVEVGYILLAGKDYQDRLLGYGIGGNAGAETVRKPTGIVIHSSNKSRGVNVPGQMEISFEDGAKTLVSREKDSQIQSVLGEFSGFQKMAVKSIMGGELLSFKGTGRLNGTQTMSYSFFQVR